MYKKHITNLAIKNKQDMYNPFDLAKKTEHIVVQGKMKKYYRFRPTKFYGGIATADTVGCNLRCAFCWSNNSVWNAQNTGTLYSPENVAERILSIATKKGYHQVRISGGEPTIGRQHLLTLLENIPTNTVFILETNGLLLGADTTYVEALSKFSHLHVRVCLKGCTSEEFSWLTGAKNGYEYQLKALENLRDHYMKFTIALVTTKPDKQELMNKLMEMKLGNIMIEEEEIILYPKVRKRLEQKGILHHFNDKD